MYTVEVSDIAKSFGATQAVDGVSLEAMPGEILGLLGPNGAGKTTTIRVMLGILQPDCGRVAVLGGPMTEAKKDRIGYMPEERGLYQDMPLERCLLYLASLKGVPTGEARRRLAELLRRFDLAVHKGKKVKALSKGMQQKAQMIATVLHRPELVVVDEPFAGLDPLNVQLVKDVMEELRAAGATILMSTHQMHQLEALCDRILLIDRGRAVLYGSMDDIRRRFASHAVLVRARGELPRVAGVKGQAPHNGAVKLTLADDATPHGVLQALLASGAAVERFEIAIPTLDEIFVRVVGEGHVG